MNTTSLLPSRSHKADFNGDGFTDILWKGQDGSIVIFNMDASGLNNISSYGLKPPSDWTLRGWGDLSGNGTSDMIFQDSGGVVHTWTFRNNQVVAQTDLLSHPRREIELLADFDGNNHIDSLWYTPPASTFGGVPGVWTASGLEDRKIPVAKLAEFPKTSLDYKAIGTGDFDGDGMDGLLSRGQGGGRTPGMLLQEPTGGQPVNGVMPVKMTFITDPGREWSVVSLSGDFNGDSKSDILWQHTTGARSVWIMDGNHHVAGGMIYDPGQDWRVIAVQDYNNDGKSDLMVRHTSGWNCEYLMDGSNVVAFGASFAAPGDFWSVVG